MAGQYIDTPAKLQDALQHWKGITFLQGYLNLEEAMASMGSDQPLVEAKQDYPGRWVLCKPGQKGIKPAVFHFAAVWRWNSDLETGNYVPPDAIAPAKLAESRVQNTPGNLCQFSYAIDTRHDQTIWKAQETFENYVKGVQGFNRSHKLRRTWQDGSDTSSAVFVLSSQVFLRRTRFSSRKEIGIPYTLHPWILAASKDTNYFGNPDRPKFFEPCGHQLRDMNDCVPPHIKTGDLVWISFFVEFIIGLNNWATAFTPFEIVRVGTVAPDLVGDMAQGDEVEEPHQGLQAGDMVMLGEGLHTQVGMHSNVATGSGSVLYASVATEDTDVVMTDSTELSGSGGSRVLEPNEVAFGPFDAREGGPLLEIPVTRPATPSHEEPLVFRAPTPDNLAPASANPGSGDDDGRGASTSIPSAFAEQGNILGQRGGVVVASEEAAVQRDARTDPVVELDLQESTPVPAEGTPAIRSATPIDWSTSPHRVPKEAPQAVHIADLAPSQSLTAAGIKKDEPISPSSSLPAKHGVTSTALPASLVGSGGTKTTTANEASSVVPGPTTASVQASAPAATVETAEHKGKKRAMDQGDGPSLDRHAEQGPRRSRRVQASARGV